MQVEATSGPLLTVDEVEKIQRKNIASLVAAILDRLIHDEKLNRCNGCVIHHPSQREHSCLMMDTEDERTLELHFNSGLKASVTERFNRTFKNKMYKYFTAKNTLSYIYVLPQLVSSYNNTYHRSIKMKPTQVTKAN